LLAGVVFTICIYKTSSTAAPRAAPPDVELLLMNSSAPEQSPSATTPTHVGLSAAPFTSSQPTPPTLACCVPRLSRAYQAQTHPRWACCAARLSEPLARPPTLAALLPRLSRAFSPRPPVGLRLMHRLSRALSPTPTRWPAVAAPFSHEPLSPRPPTLAAVLHVSHEASQAHAHPSWPAVAAPSLTRL